MNFANINTITLFSSNNNTAPIAKSKQESLSNFTRKITVDTLAKKSNTEFNFDARELLFDSEKIQRKKNEYYSLIYKNCCDDIKAANKISLTHLEYTVPKWSNYYCYYCSKECIEFIKKHLEEQKLNVFVINDRKIYITWHDLEKKMHKKN
jgi:hypothetical protein